MIPPHYLRRNDIANLLPVLSYDDDSKLFVLEDKALAFAFTSPPISGGDSSTADRLQILLSKNWPKASMIQIMQTSLPDITGIISYHRKVRADCIQKARADRSSRGVASGSDSEIRAQESLIQTLSNRQSQYWFEGSTRPLLPRDNLRSCDNNVIITLRYPISAGLPSNEEMIIVSRAREEFEAVMKSVGFAPRHVDAGGWIRIVNSILCQDPNAEWRREPYTPWDEQQTLRDQAVDPGSGFRIEQNRIDLGNERSIKFLAVKRFPEFVYFGMAREFFADMRTGSRGIRNNCVLFATVWYGDHESERSQVGAEAAWVTHTAFGPMLKWKPDLARQKHSFDALQEAIGDGDRVIRMYFGIMLICDHKDEAYAVANTITFFRERQFSLVQDTHIMIPALCMALPLCADPNAIEPLKRFKRMAGRHAVAVAPILGDWKGTGTPLMTFVSRSGQLMFMSPYDSPASYNSITIGGSGGGKSFLTNFQITGMLSMGGRVWIIDIGRSYTNLCALLYGQLIHFGKDSDFCLNPFELVQDYRDEADVLLGIVLSMAFQNNAPDDYQVSGVRRILNEQWDIHQNDLLIDHIEDSLLKSSDPRLSDIGHQLFAFTSKGDYGQYFNGKNTVNLNNRLVLIELEELRTRPHLQKVVLLQLIYQIQQECYLGDRDIAKGLYVDEGWALLAGKSGGDGSGSVDPVLTFLEGAYRRFRKYGATVNLITQGLEEIYATSNGRAIVANSPNMYMLRQKEDVVEKARKENHLSMGDGAFELLKSIHTAIGEYSEVFCITEYGVGIGRLVVDPFTRFLYSTTPTERKAIRDIQDRGFSVEQAIAQLIGEEPAATREAP